MTDLFPADLTIVTTEMHAGGHPLRIVESGIPEPPGVTNSEKRAWLQTSGDHYRRLVMCEPRGHKDMFGALLVTPDLPQADLGLIFINNSGYSPMCGHAVMCLSRYAVDQGLVPAVSPETRVVLQCPCGPVTAYVTCHNNVTSDVRFKSVPSYVYTPDVQLSVPGVRAKPLTVDVVWGGAFYAFLSLSQLDLNVSTVRSSQLLDVYDPIREALSKAVKLRHPDHDDLAFLHGIIFTDGKERGTRGDLNGPHVHICVFADKQVDRSPCGSGTSARVALETYRGVLPLGHGRHFRSGSTGSEFKGRAMHHVQVEGAGPDGEDVMGVVAEVGGRSHYTGSSTFTVENADLLAAGFSVR